jgi:hypothetical protein
MFEWDIGAWKPILFYFLLISFPLFLYHIFRLQKYQQWNSFFRQFQYTIPKYLVYFSGAITTYHLLLTLLLTFYFVQLLLNNLKVAVDLSYYTKTSIKTYQAYDAIQSGEYDYSYYTVKNYQLTADGGREGLEEDTEGRRRLSSHDDLVVVYHTATWKNVLTSDLLIDICQTEKNFIAELSGCIGADESSMIALIFTPDCQYRTSYEESLYLFGLEENSQYVENNVNPNDPVSHILVSYLSVTCSLKLSEVNSAVSQSTVGHIHINYAQTDLIIEAFLNSGLHDIKLSVIAVLICYVILSVSLHFNFFFAGVTILCILLALTIAIGLLPAFGYDYLSAFNVLAIFVITGVGSDAILIFISAWHKYYQEEYDSCTSSSVREIDLETIFIKSYRSTAPALIFTVATTVLSFMSNLVSPIIVVSQLGAFMGSSMLLYFIFLHLIAIPTWISLVRLKKSLSLYIKRHQQARWGAGIENSSTMLIEEQSPEWSASKEESLYDDCLMGCFKGMLWCLGEKSADLFDENVTAVLHSSPIIFGIDEARLSSCKKARDVDQSLDVTAFSLDSSHYDGTSVGQGRPLGEFPNHHDADEEDVVTVTDSSAPDSVRYSKKNASTRQPMWLGCGGLALVIMTLFGVLFLLLALLRTDWGLPLIFPKKDNISGLMYVAVHYKPDILSLSSDGESSNPPIVVYEPTAHPTLAPNLPTVSPTTPSPTSFSTLHPTFRPTPAPTDLDSNDDNTGYTDYSVDVCYGLGIKTHSIDSDATAKFNADSFASYVETSFLADTQLLCTYLSDNRKKLEVTTPENECLYDSLMAVSSDESMSIYDRIYLWMQEDKNRYRYVGAEVPENKSQGNFGKYKTLSLTWVCQPFDCRANVSSFFDDPDHAIMMIDRWDHAVYDKGDPYASQMGVSTLTSSDAWLFPVLSKSLVKALLQSSMISFLGCLGLLLLSTWNLKLVMLIGLSMFFIIVISLTAHALSFSNTINLIDVVVLISFIGIIIDYPTHMAFHYQHDIAHSERESFISSRSGGEGLTEQTKHQHSFNYMRKSLIGPAFTTICSAIPLLFAEFTLISKAGEYVVILTLVTYAFVTLLMPTLLRMEKETVLIPPQLITKLRLVRSPSSPTPS